MKLKIGDRVTLKPNCQYYEQSYDVKNDCYSIGTIVEEPYKETQDWVGIEWDTGYMNYYQIENVIKDPELIDNMLKIIENYESR
jgi:hypothetical protein